MSEVIAALVGVVVGAAVGYISERAHGAPTGEPTRTSTLWQRSRLLEMRMVELPELSVMGLSSGIGPSVLS